jgi:hypothetical protein
MDGEEFDRAFDEAFENGEDMTRWVDWSKGRRPGREARRVNVDFPPAVVARLDAEAAKMGITRQSLIKVWISDRLAQCAPPVPEVAPK